jgi:DNA-directed RNA polymerase specialized sigma24 family protein
MDRPLEVWVDEVLPPVHALAAAVCADRAVAESIATRVVLDGARGRAPRADLEQRAVALAVRAEPVASLAPMLAEDREAVALARLAGRSVPQIARALGVEEREVSRRMLRGLRAAAGELVGAAA